MMNELVEVIRISREIVVDDYPCTSAVDRWIFCHGVSPRLQRFRTTWFSSVLGIVVINYLNGRSLINCMCREGLMGYLTRSMIGPVTP